MIYSISGLLRQVAPTYCVVEACGVGYQCSASTHTLSSLPGRGQEVTLLTHLWVKEDGMELFGFSTEQERRCFRMLIGVSGVGPRVALAILSDSAPDRLMLSIAAGDAKALTRAQGVGAKLAQRIILELRDKVSDEDISMPFSDEIGTSSTVAETIHNTAKSEAISALVALGYGQTDAAAVIAPMEDSLAVDELIRRALKSFTRGKYTALNLCRDRDMGRSPPRPAGGAKADCRPLRRSSAAGPAPAAPCSRPVPAAGKSSSGRFWRGCAPPTAALPPACGRPAPRQPPTTPKERRSHHVR